MHWWKSWFRRRPAVDPFLQDKQQLLQEIRKAQQEWRCAREKFDYAHSKDEIDYAILTLEAAEKRYDMLIKDAKRLRLKAFHNEVKEETG